MLRVENKRLSMRSTLRDIAGLAGVDQSTVSRVLRADPSLTIREETRVRIATAARQLNYAPNSIARSLKLRHSFTLGVLIPDIANPVFPEIIKGAEDAAREQDYLILLTHVDDQSFEERVLRGLIQQGRVDGLLLATAQIRDTVIAQIRTLHGPLVLVNRRADGSGCYVITDDVTGAQLATDHVTQLGHRRIAHLAGPLFTDTALRRLQGYRESLRKSGLDYDGALVEECGFTIEQGARGMRRLLERSVLFTAVFAANLQVAIGAMVVLRDAGLRVPTDVSVIGFHDAPLAQMVTPPLTVVKFPLYDMGYRATKALLNLISGSTETVQEVLPPLGLVQRGSTAPPPTAHLARTRTGPRAAENPGSGP